MKKPFAIGLILVLLFVLAIPALAFNAQLSAQNLSVNGIVYACEKYNIDGNNYFKLRDLAQLLNNTGSQFDVGWNAAAGIVAITTQHAYTTPNGHELELGSDKSQTAQVSSQTIMIDGVVRNDLTVYNIGGSNFFKLREMGNALGFNVDYNAETNTAIVTSIENQGQQLQGNTSSYSANGISISIGQPRIDDSWSGYYSIDLAIKDNAGEDIYYVVSSLLVNGFQLPVSLSGEVYSGMSLDTEILFTTDSMKLANIEHILDVEVTLELYTSENNVFIDKPVLSLKTFDSALYSQNYNFNWQEVFNENGITIRARFGNIGESYPVVFYVENNSGSQISLWFEDIAINGMMTGISSMWGASVIDNAKCVTGMQRMMIEVTSNNVPKNEDISSVTLKFSIVPIGEDGSVSSVNIYTSNKITILR